MEKQEESKKKAKSTRKEVAKSKFIGTVIREFKTSKGVHRVGTEYDCKDKFSKDYLISSNKIK